MSKSKPSFSPSFNYPEMFRERPYIYVVNDEHHTTTCHYCLTSAPQEALSRCGACRFARYCNGRCQRAAWADHKGECALLKKLGGGRFPSTFPRLITRMWLKGQQPFTPDERLPKELQQRRLSDIPHHFGNILEHEKMKAEFESAWIGLQKYAGGALKKEDALDMYGKLVVHSQDIQCASGESLCGRALYIGAASLTPSCDPDTFAVSGGGIDLVIRAAKPGVSVEKPTELTCDYLSFVRVLMTTSERRALLSTMYGFHCNCKMCLDLDRDADMRSMRCQRCAESVPVADDPLKKTAECPKCGFQNDVTEAVELMKTIGALMDEFKLTEMDETKALRPVQFDQKMKQVLNLYYGRASALLSRLNTYAVRLVDYVIVAVSDQERIKLQLQSFPTYQRFALSFNLERALKSVLFAHFFIKTGDLIRKEEGKDLLQQAAHVLNLHHKINWAKQLMA